MYSCNYHTSNRTYVRTAVIIIIGTVYVYLSDWGVVDKSFLEGPW